MRNTGLPEVKASRELDVLVAEKVMGYRWEEWETGRGLYTPDGIKVAKRLKKDGMELVICEPYTEALPTMRLPMFSVRMDDATEVLTLLRRRFGQVELVGFDDVEEPGQENEHSDLTYWECVVGHEDRVAGFASAGTPALAISLAALKALGHEYKGG